MTTPIFDGSRRALLGGALLGGATAVLHGCATSVARESAPTDPDHDVEVRTSASRSAGAARKTIGVLGIGAQATLAFETQLHHAAQRVLPPRATFGYPPLVVYHHRGAPLVVKDDLSPDLPMRADPALLDAARWLATRADLLVLTSNGAHELRPEIEAASGRPLVSMIEATLEEVRRRGWRRVGVLAFFDSSAPVYTRRMRELGLAWESIDAKLQEPLNDAVFRCMEGREDERSRAAVRAAVAALRARGVDGIIPGCTELPILLGADAAATDLVNPSELLAEAVLQRSLAV